MATTANGTPYVETSDLVANYPGVSLALANHIDDSTGKILQVVSATTVTAFSTTAASFTDWTGMSVSITPSATSSKVLVVSNFFGGMDASTDTGMLILVRDATTLGASTDATTRNQNHIFTSNSSARIATPGALTYLDSPATTSATTYKLQLRTANLATLYLNRWALSDAQGASSTITVMEVGA